MDASHAALRSRFSAMDTTALMRMWGEQSLESWAETVLQEELQTRGIDEAALQQASKLRLAPALPKPLSIRDTFMLHGALGNFGCGILGTALYTMLVGNTGPRIALIAPLVCLGVYQIILMRRLLAHNKQPVTGGDGFLQAMLWFGTVSTSLILLVAAAALAFG